MHAGLGLHSLHAKESAVVAYVADDSLVSQTKQPDHATWLGGGGGEKDAFVLLFVLRGWSLNTFGAAAASSVVALCVGDVLNKTTLIHNIRTSPS